MRSRPTGILASLVAAAVLFLVLFAIFQQGWMGGGDVKLLVALAAGLPFTGVIQLLTTTAFAGVAAVPEIDGSTAVSAITLIGGAALVLRSRRKR